MFNPPHFVPQSSRSINLSIFALHHPERMPFRRHGDLWLQLPIIFLGHCFLPFLVLLSFSNLFLCQFYYFTIESFLNLIHHDRALGRSVDTHFIFQILLWCLHTNSWSYSFINTNHKSQGNQTLLDSLVLVLPHVLEPTVSSSPLLLSLPINSITSFLHNDHYLLFSC